MQGFRLVFMFNVLRGNRQSSVHANSFSQNIAPMGKTAPTETTTCIWFTPSQKVKKFVGKTCMSGSNLTLQTAINNKVLFIFNMP